MPSTSGPRPTTSIAFPKRTLHLVVFLDGWPGALVAQQVFRHKNRKVEFLIWTGLIALAHVAFWIWMSLR